MKVILTFFAILFSIYTIFFSDTKPLFDLTNQSSDNQSSGQIYLRGLNSYDSSTLIELNGLIESFGYKCEILSPIETSYQENFMKCSEIQNELGGLSYFDYDDSRPITIYVTNSELLDVNGSVRGLCYGNNIYTQDSYVIKQTVTHELLHSFGLNHCDNECIMNTHKPYSWNDIENKPILCNDCRSKAPSQF